MKKIYSILSLIGMGMWTAAIFLRGTSLMDNVVLRRILWVAPNFGVVWAGIGFTYLLFPRIFKREFEPKYTIPLLGIIFVLLLLAEIIHHVFLDSPFDLWDMLASIISSIIIIAIYLFIKYREDYYNFKK